MIKERPVSTELKELLVNNEPHVYAHLIKFERPSRPGISGLVSTSAERYTYITDGSRNIRFDDNSVDNNGVANGEQIYIANKVLKVGSILEQTKATAGTTSITLDGNAVGSVIYEEVTITTIDASTWDILFPVYTNPVLKGFREGDKIRVEYDTGGAKVDVNISSFRANNTMRVTKIDTSLTATTDYVTISLASEEIVSILLDKNSTEYASFINREVFIYKAFFDADINMVGEPVLIFKGIINSVGFDDSGDSIEVTWGLTSHWGDFSKVKGRITSDAFHRALDADGVPQPESALKPVYAFDKGFAHSESSINMLASYTVQVEKQRVKSKKGFLGIGAKVKVKTYLEPEERHTDLDFQLKAKSIPLVYGVRVLEGIPIFADTLKDNSAEVYLLLALSEGEIAGIYDVYINGNSLICNDKADFDARSAQTSDNTVELICRGRADAGDVLAASVEETAGSTVNYYNTVLAEYGIDYYNIPGIGNFNTLPIGNYTTPGTYAESNTSSGHGVLHGEVIKLTNPQDIEIEIFSGKETQKASAILVDIAANNNFKIQSSYWAGGTTEEYWGPNHRLVDTAYVLVKAIIAEGETTLPELEFVVRGKLVDCYNYDYSYEHYEKATGESADNFPLGSTVSLYNSTGGTLLNSNVQIIDKWSFYDANGNLSTRFRFSNTPNLSYTDDGLPTIKKFYMSNGSNTWTMITHNYKEFIGTLDTTLSSAVSAVSDNAGKVRVSFSSNTNLTIEGDPDADSPLFTIVDTNYDYLTDSGPLNTLVFFGSVTSTTLDTKYDYNTFSNYFSAAVGNLLASKNTIKLPSSASSSNDYYVGMIIEVSRVEATGKVLEQRAEIIGYDGTSRIATIGSVFSFIPKVGDTISVSPKYADSRVSINTPMQLLDYVKSPIYGRGLSITKDIDLPSWMEAARYCDSKSDVTIKVSSSTASLAVNDVYRYPSSGNIIWQGKVSAISGEYITFTEVIGKITNKWNSWKYFNTNELVYNDTTLYRINTPGVQTTTSNLITNSSTGSFSISKVSGSGPSTLTTDSTDGNPVRALRNGKEVSGYSLYDCDSIDYWRLIGWDEHSQRYVSRFQTNLVIDTSNPIFENVNSLLDHCNGIMRYTSGKYYLDIEQQEPVIVDGDIRNITLDDIIGKIQLSDEGTRSAYNSLTAAYPDPANRFEASNISFFNSEYLKIDRNVPKKGNLSLPAITNYYNTRMVADTFLNKSRYGLTINFTVRHHGFLLLAGTVIELTYPRYGWNNKPFRIESINYYPDGLVDINASEYDDIFYSLNRLTRATASGATRKTRRLVSVGPPSNLRVTSADTLDELNNGVELLWDNNPLATSVNVVTEIYGSKSRELYLTVTDILGGSVLETSETNHYLEPGMPIFPENNYLDELSTNLTYYVRETNANNGTLGANQFTLSLDKRNLVTPESLPDLLSLTTGSSLSIRLRTATLLSSVRVPGNSYIDLVADEVTGRVEKYYWIRHRVEQ